MLLKAYAKVNLFLDVIEKRVDNYHNILTLFQSIPLYDEIDIEFSEKEIFTSTPKFNFPWNNNLIKKAIDTFKSLTEYSFNLKIHLNKKLPEGGGIGGGSADAAAVLRFLKDEYNISDNDIIEIGAKVGGDVPFLIFGGTAIAEGIGDKLTFLEPLKLNFEFNFPGIHISTPEMYNEIDKSWSKLTRFGDPMKLYEGLKERDYIKVKENTFNIFEQVVFPKYPKLKRIKENMDKNSIISLMSGSGSTIFSIQYI
ncbi:MULTISPECIES: 4-(cytidine 5'-diphospho)-2-C-methyl-D-erythritol kinase [unclassified Marinitoga]|uniref:4-(cytidine 5'-diphospho)-2-C-methyl-D-erythritol kinase n=1 Tax=unclassified Marinitoga TaxID=2640159 RepID=UPI0006414C84|nr:MULTISPECIES: 4-(cytidine 5'-diphospho)-2-C-methyl-D-erythritol kinase [unclassified Marinitoga]KLO23696.1 4-diphosphocytidyl-2C-methyl-D-erythritol kinase [Marinitoga sp. 1155]NUV00148.1 4-diphosphocytidyl-2C-methyl-D-erythritol kinase [Marinitoga sp. 1154]